MQWKIKRAGLFLLAAAVLSGTAGGIRTDAAEVGVSGLSDKGTAAPEAWGAVPSPNQYRYQKEELAAFCHFGPNTFNEVEWGESYGSRTPDDIFRLEEDFDAETLVKTLQEAGFKKLIVTAKHHDGFCIWASEYTTYDVSSTSYKDGQGDVLAEISAACTKYDLDMGLYLSPWDIHEPSYGYYDENGKATTAENDVLDYNEYYNNQLQEILGNDKYGNNGHFVEVWMDGAKGSGANAQEYDFETWFATIQANEGIAAGYDDDCMLFGAEAYTTVRWIGNELGLANEETWAKSKTDKEANTIDNNTVGGYTVGHADGNQWTVPEADARITSGWFWGNTKKTPKSISELANMYFNSVGHNATLLLNIPPNDQGTVDEAILNRVIEFGQNIQESFETNLAANAVVTASEVRGNDVAFSPENVIDGDDATYWTMEDGTTTGSLTLNLGGTKTFDLVTIEEAIQLGQRISGFTVEYRVGDGEWKTFGEGTTIGAKRICRGNAVKADQIRINITDSYAVPLLSEVGVYKASEGFEAGSAILDELTVISVTDKDTSDGAGFTYSGWTAETGDQFIEGNSMYANAGAEAPLTFTGSKVWLYGTRDSGHGTADIYIDGEKVDSINTQASVKATGQAIYESADLDYGSHTLRIVNTGTIGLDAAAVLDNEGRGMVQFETKTLEMEEDTEELVVVKRVGGSTGEITVTYENNPGSAVQGHYDVDGIGGTLTFADGETEKTITVKTKRYIENTGDLNFTVDLVDAGGGAVLGFNTTLKVTIRDLDSAERLEEARKILSEAQALDYSAYHSAGQTEVKILTKELNAYLAAEDKIARADIFDTAKRLKQAIESLTVRENYTTEDPFVMPSGSQVKLLEAELFTLDAQGAVNANNYVRITERENASNGKEVNWFENGNRIYLPFTASKAGTYKVTATYRSGRDESSPNAFEWSGTNITSGSVDVYGPDATVFKTIEFEIEVTQAGAGELVFTASSKAGPVIDKFEIECVDKSVERVAVTGVSLNKEEVTLTEKRPYVLLLAEILPADATNQSITFTSSNPEAAVVDSNGLVFVVANGEAVITAETADGGKTAQCKILVELPTEPEPEPEPSGSGTTAPDRQPSGQQPSDQQGSQTIQAGKTYVVEGYFYKVTSTAKQTVTVTGMKNTGLKKITVYNTVNLGGKNYKVTSIAANAFKNNKKATSASIGNNVQTIGKNAFSGCTKLKKVTVKGNSLKKIAGKAFFNCKKLSGITIKSKVLKTVGKNALKGIYKKAVIKVPASKQKAYTKLFAKKGQSSTVKIKK